MTNDELDQAIRTAQELFKMTGDKTETGKKARAHLSGLLDEQMRRALAKPGPLESTTEANS